MIPVTVGRYPLGGARYKSQGGQNGMKYRPSLSPDYIMVANGPEGGKNFACPRSYHNIYSGEKDKETLSRSLKSELIVLPPFTMSVKSGHVQNAGTEYLAHHNLNNNVCSAPDTIKLPNVCDGI